MRLTPILLPIIPHRSFNCLVAKRSPISSCRKSPLSPYQGQRDVHFSRTQRIVHQNGISWSTTVAIAVAVGASISFAAQLSRTATYSSSTESHLEPRTSEALLSTMPTSMPPGRPGTLTPEQEAKLRELWHLMLTVFGVAEPLPPSQASPNGKSPLSRTSTSSEAQSAADVVAKKKKSRLSFLKKKSKDLDESASDTSTGSGTSTPSSGKWR